MAIKSSAGRQIERLIADLSSDRQVVRDAAVARLAVIGTRAVARLVEVASSRTASSTARSAALRALEGIDDTRAADAALALADEDEADIAIAAIAVARAHFSGPRGTAAIDRVTAVATNPARDASVREAALEALADLDREALEPLLEELSSDPQPGVRELAERLRGGRPREEEDSAALISAAARGELPEDPEVLRQAIVQAAASEPLPVLRQLIDVVRQREASAAAAEQPLWLAVRGAAHATLSRRRSRLALVDLRETLETASAALPIDFVAALVEIGDASCLDAIAAAWERVEARGDRDGWWRRHLADAFQAIVARERLTRRHAVMKRLEKRRPAAAAALRDLASRQ